MFAVEIRTARPDEYPAVTELTVRVYLAAQFVEPGAPYLTELADTARRAAEAEVLVAVAGTELLGSVTFALGGTRWAETARPGEAAFRMLVVDPAARGAGVGAALVTYCVDRARTAGARALRLSSGPEMAAAHRLYARLGFVRTPEDDWTPEPGVNLITFAMDLG